LDRFGDVGGFYIFYASQIGDGLTYFQDPAVGSGAQAEFVDRCFQ
jgi:hypothetical protein